MGLLSGSSARASVSSAEPLGGLPLFFEPQSRDIGISRQYLARGLNFQISIEPTQVQFAFQKLQSSPLPRARPPGPLTSTSPVLTRVARMRFVGADPQAAPQGIEALQAKVNYLIGNHPATWRAGVPIYSAVRIAQLYPGIDLLFYGNLHELEYDISVFPGGDPGHVAINFDGVDGLALNDQGELVLSLGENELHLRRPTLYQIVGGVRHHVSGGYRLVDNRTVGFNVGRYDRGIPLVIDPIFSYSTFFGGNGGETGLAVKVDAAGSVYVAGQTMSTRFQFPVPGTAFQPVLKGGISNGDAFVAKLDNTGSNLLYFTYLGGSADDTALDLAVDSSGNAYLTGFTDSADFPTQRALFGHISGVADPTLHIYPLDAFVAELNADGSALIYSTFLGGEFNDVGSGIAVDPAGNAYVTGYSDSATFPLTNAIQGFRKGGEDAFVAKIAPNGTRLIYSTYLGGSQIDQGEGIAADAAGYAYVTGYTDSTDFPLYKAENSALNGTSFSISVYDAFVTRINPNGSGFVYSTYLGGSNNDFGFRITVDAARNAYVTGSSQSPDFPHRQIGFKIGNNGTNALNFDAFLTRLNPSGSRTYSILFGGTGTDEGWDVAVDAAGRAFVVGSTISTNFPVVNPSGLFRTFNSGGKDAFVTAFNADGTAVHYSGYLGGAADDYGYGIAVDAESSAFVTGLTFSGKFPTSSNAFQSSLRGPSNAFLTKIRLFDPMLSTATAGSTLLLSWPITAPEYMLESTSSLGPAANWLPVQQPPVVNSSVYTVSLGLTNGPNFFRLHGP